MSNIIPMDHDAARNRLKVLQKQYFEIEKEMVDLALEFNLELWLSQGRLLLTDDEHSWKGRGEWFTSTDSCS